MCGYLKKDIAEIAFIDSPSLYISLNDLNPVWVSVCYCDEITVNLRITTMENNDAQWLTLMGSPETFDCSVPAVIMVNDGTDV